MENSKATEALMLSHANPVSMCYTALSLRSVPITLDFLLSDLENGIAIGVWLGSDSHVKSWSGITRTSLRLFITLPCLSKSAVSILTSVHLSFA